MMQSSPRFAPEEEAYAVARALCGRPVAELSRGGRGGNNRIYRVHCTDGASFALKAYPGHTSDPRDRIGTEFAALRFLREQGLPNVPAPVKRADDGRYALYEWIEGEAVLHPGGSDLDQALELMAALWRMKAAPGAAVLPLASEACLSLEELISQVERRILRLEEVAGSFPQLQDFLKDFRQVFAAAAGRARAGFSALDLGADVSLPPAARTLSPSDFGFHNALRRPDGRLVFVDFEYFGWDEPVKLVADFLLHPGMELSPALASRFHSEAPGIFAGDSSLAERLDLCLPLYGLRWCGILLNEFLPERWYRRSFALGEADAEAARARQLGKAQARLDAVRRGLEGQ